MTWAFLDKFQILAALSSTQKKQSSEVTEFSTNTWKISNWVMPSAFIWIKNNFIKKIKKILGISKAIRIFESPLLCIWQFECSVHIFRGLLVSLLNIFWKGSRISESILLKVELVERPSWPNLSHQRKMRKDLFAIFFLYLHPKTMWSWRNVWNR